MEQYLIKTWKRIFLLTLSISLTCLLACCQSNGNDGLSDTEDMHASPLEHFDLPSDWSVVSTSDYTIGVPPTVESASRDDLFRTFAGNANVDISNILMFQQKGLGNASLDKIDEHYCRIIARTQHAGNGDYPSRGEILPIDDELRSILRQRVDSELGDFALVSGPSYRWIDVEGAKVMEVHYVRGGNNGNTTNCRIYILFDNNRMVDIMVTYREQEESLWVPDLTNVIKTFRWK